jgi:ATP-binding cassette subfamily B protein
VAPAATVLNILMIALMSGGAALAAVSQRNLIDGALLSDEIAVAIAVGLGVLAHAGTFILTHIQGETRQDLTVRVARELDGEVLGLAAGIPTLEHLERPEFLDRVTNLRRGTMALASGIWWVATLVGTAVSLAVSVWLLFDVHVALPLLASAAVPLFFLTKRGARLRRRSRDENAENERLQQELHEMCIRRAPAKELRISGSAATVSLRALGIWEKVTAQITRAWTRAFVYETAGWVVMIGAIGAALALVIALYSRGDATLGDVVLLITLATALSGQLQSMVLSFNIVSDAGHVTGHYLWLKEYGNSVPVGDASPPEKLESSIRLERVSFTYPGADSPVLQDVDLELQSGNVVAIVGLNGAGKTTMVKLLGGLYRPDHGRISVDGVNLSAIAPRQWSDRCAGVFQDFAKFQFLARENIGVGDLDRFDDREAIAKSVQQAGADGVIDSLPRGLDTQLGSLFQGAEPSFGQWQKLALARSYMRRRPLLLVLDEPTSALDPQAEHELFESFTAYAHRCAEQFGTISVIVSHRFSTVNMADHIVVIDDGRVAEQGSHAALLESGGRYADLYLAQARTYQ